MIIGGDYRRCFLVVMIIEADEHIVCKVEHNIFFAHVLVSAP